MPYNMVLIKKREAKGWTQVRLAEESGLTDRTIWSAENGQNVSPKTKYRIANALGTTVTKLWPEENVAV